MDPEEFAQSYVNVLKSVCKVAPCVKKSELLRAIKAAKLSLSAAEAQLFSQKFKGAITFARKRLRDAGSGIHLPSSVKALMRVWARHGKEKAEQKKRNMVKNNPAYPTKAKKVVCMEEENSELSIRQVFGLREKVDVTKVDLTSDDEHLPQASTSASSASSSSAGSLKLNSRYGLKSLLCLLLKLTEFWWLSEPCVSVMLRVGWVPSWLLFASGEFSNMFTK